VNRTRSVNATKRAGARLRPGFRQRAWGLATHPQAFVVALLAVYVIGIGVLVPQMLSWETVHDVVIAMLPLAVVVIGETFVLIVAGIDLSVTAVMGMGSVVAASIMTGSGGYLAGSALAVPAGILSFLGIGFLVGLFNGTCSARLRMPPFIVTLSTLMFVAGAAVWYTSFHSRSVSISNLPEAFRKIGYGSILGVPIAFLLAVIVALAAHAVLSRTLLGRWLYAVGRNERAARISGVPVERVVTTAFVISGLCAALAAVIYTSRVETGTPVLAQNLFLDVIGAAVIGGVSLFGGRGTVLAALMGVLFLTVLDKGLQLLGLSLFMVLAVKGTVILLAAVLDVFRQRWSEVR
jgi:ribose/xylose/arabinose/galactoside ABC-type transport system permease subunit